MTTQISMLERPAPAGDLELYPFQAWAVDELARAKRDGHLWTILCSPTGSGKTEIAIHLIDRARKRDMRVAFVCDRRTLVKQTSDRFAQYGIPHGVAMAEKTFGRSMPIQICSVQTIQKRGYWPALDLLVIDEAHTQHKGVLKFAKNWGGPVIGLTATPLTEGLGQWYSKVVNAVTTDRLLADGYLAPLKMYAATEIDMTGAKKTAGEWQKEEVRKRGRPIIGDIVSTWERMTRQHFGGPVKTLLFSADIAHGEELCKAFQAAGHDFRQSTYRDGIDETEAMVEGFRSGEFTGLVSVEKFVKGFDVPDVLCMIGARPYSSSLASVIQQMGRGMRIAEGKEFCVEGSQRVLTKDRGLVRIDQIQWDDLLWDGVEWVSHGGVVYKGKREVITYAGLTATTDHRVYTTHGWQTLGEAARNQYRIMETGVGGTPIRECENRFRADGNQSVTGWRQAGICSVPMCHVREHVDYQSDESQKGQDKGLSKVQPACADVPTVAFQTLRGDGATLRQPEHARVGTLRRSRDRISVWFAEDGVPLDNGAFGPTSRTIQMVAGPDQQRPSLRARESSLGIGHRATEQPATQWRWAPVFPCLPSPASRSTIRGLDAQTTFVDGIVGRRDHQPMAYPLAQAEGEVWDILNAGPRNRFTCEGLLVHNCLYLDHAGNVEGWYDDVMDFWANGVDRLDVAEKRKPKRREGEDRPDVVCDCGFVLQPSMQSCPSCGAARRRRRTRAEVVPGRMEEWAPAKPAEWMKDESWVWSQLSRLALIRKSGDVEAAQRSASGYYKGMYGRGPSWGRPLVPCEGPVDERVSKRVQYNLIRYQHSQKRRNGR